MFLFASVSPFLLFLFLTEYSNQVEMTTVLCFESIIIIDHIKNDGLSDVLRDTEITFMKLTNDILIKSRSTQQ